MWISPGWLLLEYQILSSFHKHNYIIEKNYLKPEKSTTPVIIIAEMLAEFWPPSSAMFKQTCQTNIEGKSGEP